MKKIIGLFTLSIFYFNIAAQQVNIIPQPQQLTENKNAQPFLFHPSTKIILKADSLENSANFLNDYLERYFGIRLEITRTDTISNAIVLDLNTGISTYTDYYSLSANHTRIHIAGTSKPSIFYAIQTLIQLLPTQKKDIAIPSVEILDHPRFSYRGMHLDVSRHFFDVNFIKKYLDYLALHKMNYFHWHLTDDHGWRIEIKKYPKLTTVGAWRNGSIIGLWPGKGNENIRYQVLPTAVKITPQNATIKTDGIKHGGFYTQEEVREIIDYAAKRYITIIPEIEMPAHSMAALAAYPELGTEPSKKYEVAQTWGMMNKYNNVLQPTEQTFNFLSDVLTEVMALFPSPYIHIGGDEASKIWWRASPIAQKIMKDNKLNDESALQSYFIHQIEKFVNSKGKTIIGWDEILDGGLAPNAIVMSWRGEKGGIAAAKQNHKVIMTPEDKLYFNHAQFIKEDSLTATKYLPLATVYAYDPIPPTLNEDKHAYIWGAQANLWTEYITSPAKVEYMIFPRIDALSEMLWTPKQKRNYPDFLNRLKTQFKRYDLMGITYSKKYLEN